MTSFGEQLRDARRERGLSQAEIGAPAFSRSYVSLLESGERMPTEPVIDHLATRLQLQRAVVAEWALVPSEDDVSCARLLVELVAGPGSHNLDAVRDFLESNDVQPLGAGPVTARVRPLLLAAYDEAPERREAAAAAAAQLVVEQVVQENTRTFAAVVVRRCALLRKLGQLTAAVDVARAALMVLQGRPDGATYRLALCSALVSVLGSLQREAEAVAMIEELAAAIEASPDRLERAGGLWALGNLHFLAGRPEAGVAAHDQAEALFDPTLDLLKWAHFHRGTASMRLQHQAAIGTVPRHLEKATLGFQIVGLQEQLAYLGILKAQYAAHRERWALAIAELERVLEHAEWLSPQDAASAHALLASYLKRGDRAPEAPNHAAQAVDLYLSVGAYEAAVKLCAQWQIVPASGRE